MTVILHTLGCKLNQSETEALAEVCLSSGCTIGRSSEQADLVIINSCTVTGRSDAKSRHAVRFFSARNPHALVILTGCYAEVEFSSLREGLISERGAVIVSQSRKAWLLHFIAAAAKETGFHALSREEKRAFLSQCKKESFSDSLDSFKLVPEKFFFHSRAFVKIQDGCDGICAYCRVPFARGKARSLEFQAVIDKVAHITSAGFSEIVFTGVNISAYRSGEHDLASLLDHVLRHTSNVRFRLSSLEPDALTPRLLDILAAEEVCPHLHIPVQSGSDRILSLMRRRYNVRILTRCVKKIVSRKPGVFLAGDFIVGFPNESEEDFAASGRLAGDLGLAALHVFPFSPRPGTAAIDFTGRLPDNVVKHRVGVLIDLGKELMRRYLSDWKGKQVDVILEQKIKASLWRGTSAESVKCRVTGIPPAWQRPGARILAEITETDRECLAFFVQPGTCPPRFSTHGEFDLITH